MELLIDKKITHKKTITKFIEFGLNKLLPCHIVDDINLEIKYLPEKSEFYASCVSLEAEKDPRTFEIEIYKKLDLYEKIIVVAHEIVHIKQYALNEMSFNPSKKKEYVWKKKKFKSDYVYWDRPWEIEAHGREKGLAIQFIEKNYKETPNWWKEIV